MKKATKAALLSAFVFPGVGHIYLKKYTVGVLLAGASFAAIYYLLATAVEGALEISERIRSGDVQPDVETIAQLVAQQSSGADAQWLSIATTTVLICWLMGILDSYRIAGIQGKKR